MACYLWNGPAERKRQPVRSAPALPCLRGRRGRRALLAATFGVGFSSVQGSVGGAVTGTVERPVGRVPAR
jgi:hypothetical protein